MRTLSSLGLEVPVNDLGVLAVVNHLAQLQGLKVSPVQYFPALNSGMDSNE